MTEQNNDRPALTREVSSVPDLTGWFARRDTVRQFDPDVTIPDEEVREMVDAGRKVPTSGTLQMYSFISITRPEMRERIHELCGGGQPQVVESSRFLLVCVDFRRLRYIHQARDLDFDLQPVIGLLKGAVDAALAGQGVMTVAESKGYSVCPIGAISNGLDEISELVGLPPGVLPVFGLCIGVPADGAPERHTSRIPLDSVFHEDEYADPSPEMVEQCYTEMNKRYDPETGRTWEGTLANYWTPAPDGNMNARAETLHAAMRQQGFFAYHGVREERTPDGEWD